MSETDNLKHQIESNDTIRDRMRYCIIDNDAETRDLLFEYMKKQKIDNIVAAQWDQASSILDDNSHDVILAGVMEPATEGLELLRPFLGSDKRNEIILITTFAESKLSIEAFRLGVSDVLTKPICPDDLDNALQKVQRRFIHKIRQQHYFKKIQNVLEHHGPDGDHQQISQLLRGTIHNLNGPLSVISGNAQLLEIGMDDLLQFIKKYKKTIPAQIASETVKKVQNNSDLVSNILCSTDKMKDTIFSLLSKWSRESDADSREIDLTEFFNLELNYLNTNLYYKNKVAKHLAIAENLPKIKGVYADFSQTFQNLVSNALDAMYDSQQRELTISAQYDDELVCIEVHDTGCGISQENLNRIFQPYFTTKPKEKKDGDRPTGTGLGLSNCLDLMKPYGARFKVISEPRRGTRIIWQIPRTAPVTDDTTEQAVSKQTEEQNIES